MADRFFIIDGTALVYRSFFAIKGALTDGGGRPTNAAFGFARVVLKLLREQEPSHVAVVFDAPGKSFRAEMYPDYKATRPPTPEDLIAQWPMIDAIVAGLDLPMLRVKGVEADDVMATLAQQGRGAGLDCVIVSGDKDMLQVVGEGVRVYDPPSKGDEGKWLGAEEVKERFGVGPEHVKDALALMGDSADNVPGVKGIGPKTARKLLEAYGTLEGVYAHVDELKGKMQENVIADRDNAFLSRELVTLKEDVALPLGPEDCRAKAIEPARAAEVFGELGFDSLVEEFLPDAAVEETLDYTLVLTEEELAAAVAEMRAMGRFAVDTETTSVDPMRAELVGISLSCAAMKAYYIPVGHAPEALVRGEEGEDLFSRIAVEPLSRERVFALLGPLLADGEVGKIGHNIKYDVVVLARAGLPVAGVVMDTMVASYLTDPSRLRHNLNEVSLQYLKRKTIPIVDVIGKGAKAITFDKVPVDKACTYACEDADVTWRLSEVFEAFLSERELNHLFEAVEVPLIDVLVRMEMAGVAIDVEALGRLQDEVEGRLAELEALIFELAGESFQINSPKQLQGILFGKLGLTPKRKTKTGYSTDVEVLEELSREHPLPERLLEYRTLDKLRGTYIEALPKLVNPETGRIHSSFNQAVTATGRLSSSDPNLQNIPIRTEMGRKIRACFVPGTQGTRLISADYSQIELRVMAHLSEDERLVQAFLDDADIHMETASRVFGIMPGLVTPEMRRQAKAVNFGVIYGMSAFGLAKSLGITNRDASRFIEHYFEQYPGVQRWIEATLEQARADGYVTTLMRRRRYIPDLNSSNGAARKAAERVATNTPVQGSAADIIKVAMLKLDEALRGTEARLVLQVHDELVVECPAGEADGIAEVMRQTMAEAASLRVPLKVDVGIGNNWAEIH